ncbi:MAG: hypothetical protein NAG76_22220 [Candidatus Pristimantibacillus lignocellulolyticus]|uniref:SWIM-type domain-containing protein n=1 Tax=Candidatus Pristimantibacillus lignocellulolyticus TaxID=2994561 RepID=A0A9J6ZEL7_9BACL|nr:MAG: hypothetical protein NAG76_22220 [Candidatus Pristimantibacillus lignocellulolyticus]
MQMYNRLLTAFEQLSSEGSYSNVLKQGWKLYQTQVVQKVNVYGTNMINGIVKDIELHAVVIDSDHIRYSSCTCQQPVYCEHMAALLFQYCKMLENGKVLAEQAYFQLLGLVRASSIPSVTNSSQLEQNNEGLISQQVDPEEVFQKMMQQFGDDWKKCKHSFHPLSNTLTSIKGMAKSSQPNIQRLHWCASILFVLSLGERALQAVDSFSRYYHEMTFKRLAEPWSNQLYELLGLLQDDALQPYERLWIRSMMNFTFEKATTFEKPMFEWDYAYYRLIGFLAADDEQNEELFTQLENLVQLENREYVVSFLYGSIAVLMLGKKADERAIYYLDKCQFDRVQRIIYPIVENRMSNGQWDQVELWMDFLNDHFVQTQQVRSIGPFLQLCRKGSQQQPGNSKWLKYMVEFLPHSYAALSEHYINEQQYKDWADLQLYMGRKPEDFKANELQPIEKYAPSVLLPMYHQAIELSIHSRNRQGYRTAAKHMKKLHGLYEQLEKPNVWRSYFDMMQSRYNRLRAFQEELLKGKLL